jgi:hypothetical protein
MHSACQIIPIKPSHILTQLCVVLCCDASAVCAAPEARRSKHCKQQVPSSKPSWYPAYPARGLVDHSQACGVLQGCVVHLLDCRVAQERINLLLDVEGPAGTAAQGQGDWVFRNTTAVPRAQPYSVDWHAHAGNCAPLQHQKAANPQRQGLGLVLDVLASSCDHEQAAHTGWLVESLASTPTCLQQHPDIIAGCTHWLPTPLGCTPTCLQRRRLAAHPA